MMPYLDLVGGIDGGGDGIDLEFLVVAWMQLLL